MANKFEELLQNTRQTAPRRIWAEPKGGLYECVKTLKENHDFDHLCTITAVETDGNFDILYHLAQNKTGNLLTIRLTIPVQGAKTKSISDIFQSAVWYEREINDLFGVDFEGLPAGNRYPLPDEWPKDDHPLRKNWKPRPCEKGQTVGCEPKKEDK